MFNNEFDIIQREKKLKRVKNWIKWFNITMFILKKKDFWDIITNNCINENTAAQITNYEQDTAEAAEIIKSDITDDLFKNIKNINKSLMI